MTIPTTAAQVLRVAMAELGNKEHPAGSNRQKYGEWADDNGVAWCGIFVTWVFAHAGYDWRWAKPGAWFAYTPNLEETLREKLGFVKVNVSDAKPGDVVFYNFPGGFSRIEHTGIVESNGDGELVALEGNTSAGNDANGGQVQRRTRRYGLVASVLRPPYASAPRFALARVLKLRFPRQRGADVAYVRKLIGAGSWPVYDRAMVKAVKAWQERKGITADGQFGPESAKKAGITWKG